MTHEYSLVFLGSSGAGLQLTQGLESVGKFSFLIGNPRTQFKPKNAKFHSIFVPKHTILYVLYFIFSLLPITRKLKVIPSGEKVLFPMINPYDFNFFLMVTLLRRDLSSYVVIHDAVPHQGSFWPPPVVTRFILKRATRIITLSDYTSQSLRVKYKFTGEIAKVDHPVLFDIKLRNVEVNLPERYVVSIGRVRRYKGLDEFIKLYKRLPEPDVKLLVAGSGRISHDYQKQGVSLLNRWLTDSEFVEIIRNSEAVLLCYTEASQSGVIPIAKALNKKILFRDSGGLSEQLSGYPNAYEYTNDNFENVWNDMLTAEIDVENRDTDSWSSFLNYLGFRNE